MLPRFPRSLLLLLGALPACSTTNQVADFATNDIFYVDVPFRTKVPGDRPVVVLPAADARDASTLPNSERGFPISYGNDDFWDRPIAEMFSEVLTRQLADSELFGTVVTEAAPDALVVKPTLVSFLNGATESISGSRSFAEVAVKIEVFGPASGDGKRALLHEQTYANRQVSAIEVDPPSPYRLIGRALQLTMSKAMSGLDGSNVGRSGVPITGQPAEAAGPAR
ncbi:MAG: hypothetical protein WAT39_09905 [Planctomycetota bacterium]